jgi:hypothetical protein
MKRNNFILSPEELAAKLYALHTNTAPAPPVSEATKVRALKATVERELTTARREQIDARFAQALGLAVETPVSDSMVEKLYRALKG